MTATHSAFSPTPPYSMRVQNLIPRRRRTPVTAMKNLSISLPGTGYKVAKPGPVPSIGPAIPSELYRNIIECITDVKDLCNLSLTSRICCTEAQRVLYRAVDLAPNTRAPVLWASTVLEHPQKAAAVHALTLRFDLSFLIVPELMISSLRLISQALRTLKRLEKLVLVGHPRAMMHPIHTWILDGCTFNLRVFHNSVFPASSIIPFLASQPNLRQWSQAGAGHGDVIGNALLPNLTVLDVHASNIACFTSPRPLVRIRLKIDDNGGRERERTAVESLALFGSTLSTLIIDHSSISNHLVPAEVFGLLAEVAPNLKILVYTRISASGDGTDWECSEHLTKFSKLGVLALHAWGQAWRVQDRVAMAKRAFERCPPLECVAVRNNSGHLYARREDLVAMMGIS